MSKPSPSEAQPFFLIAHKETGEIYCAHQEYSAESGGFISRCEDEEHLINIAVKANPSCQRVKDKLKVFPVTCSPAITFSHHRIDVKKGKLIKPK